jgi:hypothetical protein
MKNQIILWISSLLILFVIGYIKNITDKNYPVTGTFGIEGYKVSYKLDKVSYDKVAYKNIIISDIKGVTGKIITHQNNEKNEIEMQEIDRGLIGEIPVQKPGERINYKILLKHKNKNYELPQKDFATLTFWGNIPSAITSLHFILLYFGLLLSIRSATELFNQNEYLKKYSIITTILFLALTILIHPLQNSYKLGAINNYIPPIIDLLDPIFIIISLVWVTGTILIFNNKFQKITTIIVTLTTILLFFLQ